MKKLFLILTMAGAIICSQAQSVNTLVPISVHVTGFQVKYRTSGWLDFKSGDTIVVNESRTDNVPIAYGYRLTNLDTFTFHAGDSVYLSFVIDNEKWDNWYKLEEDLAPNGTTLLRDMATTQTSSATQFTDSTTATISISARITQVGIATQNDDFNVGDIHVYAKKQGSLDAYDIADQKVILIRKKETPTAVAENSTSSIKMYPNPVKDNLTIDNLKNSDVFIYNVIGQTMGNFNDCSGALTVDMSTYPEGIYLVKVISGKSVRTEKIKIAR